MAWQEFCVPHPMEKGTKGMWMIEERGCGDGNWMRLVCPSNEILGHQGLHPAAVYAAGLIEMDLSTLNRSHASTM